MKNNVIKDILGSNFNCCIIQIKGIITMTIKQTRKSENVCLYCGRTLDREGIHCSVCNDKHNEWKRNHAIKYHEEGKCTNCGKDLDRESWLCRECANKANKHGRERNTYRRANGLCVQCGEPAGGYSQCRRCLDMLADRRNRKK